ncbi:MAG: imidazole glycerol phosphate synthase subunit HisH [Gemmatimonas sp.]
MRVTVFDYGAGNLHSLIKTLETPNSVVRVVTDPTLAVRDTDALVLPGVGAFSPAAQRLAPGRAVMRHALLGGLPCLGICLGMQLLFESSDEGAGTGLGVFTGRVTRVRAQRVPHIGWNRLEEAEALVGMDTGLVVAYYANSFVCRPAPESLPYVVAWSQHEDDRFPAAVRRGMLIGTQFHPEKSSVPGVHFVHAFLREAAQARATATSLMETR